MKYTLTKNQVNNLTTVLDIAIRERGVSLINEVLILLDIIKTPVEKDEETFTYELTDEYIKAFINSLDIALRSEGIQNIYNIASLIQTLSNPLEDRPAEQEEQTENEE